MKRKIYLNGERYVECRISNCEHIDVYSFDFPDKKEEIKQAMINNGYKLVIPMDEEPDDIVVNRNQFYFKGEKYDLNQCSDIFEWFEESLVYEFTYYYDRIVFHTPLGIIAAYIEDTSNYMRI